MKKERDLIMELTEGLVRVPCVERRRESSALYSLDQSGSIDDCSTEEETIRTKYPVKAERKKKSSQHYSLPTFGS